MKNCVTFYLKNCRLDLYKSENNCGVMYFFSAEAVKLTPQKDISLAVVYPYEWNEYMTPWKFDEAKAGETGGGAKFMNYFMNEVVPFVENDIKGEVFRGIGGYSLGGIEALYISASLDAFSFTASVSGSMWYQGISEYILEHDVNSRYVYLSLGDREHKTGNPLRRQVLDKTQEVVAFLEEKGHDTVFEMNEGGHFTQVDGRIDRCVEAFYECIKKEHSNCLK